MDLDGSVCRRHACSRCCHNTEMELTDRDIERIVKGGHTDFYLEINGSYVLKNSGGSCVFLGDDGRCSIYRIRPKGCRLYPLVMGMPSRRWGLDHKCPHRDEFSPDPEDIISLESLIDELGGD